MFFQDPYLRRICANEGNALRLICERWRMAEQDFCELVDQWFQNFEPCDKELAFKVIQHIDYYSQEEFEKELQSAWRKITQRIRRYEGQRDRVFIILPDANADSASKHVYDISKIWPIAEEQIIRVKDLRGRDDICYSVLIAFNDTHGTGRQFVVEMIEPLKNILQQNNLLFIAGITISSRALEYFRYHVPGAVVIPEDSAIDVGDIFTLKEYRRLEELCSTVYPSHPMGFGNTGLLTAYYFQCPNNTLPIIWADGSNNASDGNGYPWNPLFRYRSKTKGSRKSKSEECCPVFDRKTSLDFSDGEIKKINEILDSWKCSKNVKHKIIQKLNHWFGNFQKSNKKLALKIFSNINFMSLARTREEIRKLYSGVIRNIRRQDEHDHKSDIILVLTGDEIESVYHYVFDFLRIWDLKTAQAITLEELIRHPYEALNKHLVYFYHTRIHKEEYFLENIWNEAKNFPSKSNHVLSFMMSAAIRGKMEELKNEETRPFHFYYSPEISKTAKDIFTQEEMEELKTIYSAKEKKKTNIEDKYLTAYYFNCPVDSLSLLWYDKKWETLFKSKN